MLLASAAYGSAGGDADNGTKLRGKPRPVKPGFETERVGRTNHQKKKHYYIRTKWQRGRSNGMVGGGQGRNASGRKKNSKQTQTGAKDKTWLYTVNRQGGGGDGVEINECESKAGWVAPGRGKSRPKKGETQKLQKKYPGEKGKCK